MPEEELPPLPSRELEDAIAHLQAALVILDRCEQGRAAVFVDHAIAVLEAG